MLTNRKHGRSRKVFKSCVCGEKKSQNLSSNETRTVLVDVQWTSGRLRAMPERNCPHIGVHVHACTACAVCNFRKEKHDVLVCFPFPWLAPPFPPSGKGGDRSGGCQSGGGRRVAVLCPRSSSSLGQRVEAMEWLLCWAECQLSSSVLVKR